MGANNQRDELRGLDIGTGSSCIYPLLICRTHPNWRMAGSDINPSSIEIAKKNVQENRLLDRIQLFLTTDKRDSVLEGQIFQTHLFFNSKKCLQDEKPARFCYDFTMCNPPFYSDVEDLNNSRQAKTTTILGGGHEGVSLELFTTGGELLFLSQMVEESFLYKDKVGWFTTMTGKKNTALEILRLLGQHQIQETIASKLIQGKTIRWVIGWTFHKDLFDLKHPSCNTLKVQDIHCTNEEAPASKKICLGKIPLNSKEHIPSKQLISSSQSSDIGWTRLKSRLGDLRIEFSLEKLSLIGKVVYPTWTRAWRRNGKAKSKPTPFSFSAQQSDASETTIQLKLLASEIEEPDENTLVSFQSLCNHLRSYLKD
ncbi:hypothetical protein DSO57_1004779 [Entomophthora muscae]|uniref:Uncharacterized protein n=1 Tax=Entomophthora muscae TaxID=34485 RepID=A0ACC2UTY5_9FUNG|nr:hypothetical protein DSO57_1004779 [Entomophthora muscae]